MQTVRSIFLIDIPLEALLFLNVVHSVLFDFRCENVINIWLLLILAVTTKVYLFRKPSFLNIFMNTLLLINDLREVVFIHLR